MAAASYRRLGTPPRYSMIRELASDRRRETAEVKEEEEKDVWEKRDERHLSPSLRSRDIISIDFCDAAGADYSRRGGGGWGKGESGC